MRVGLIDVDGHNFPNLPLMKISAYHKNKGDSVAWYNPLTAWVSPPDRVYMRQHWVNNRIIFNSCKRFEDYGGGK